ncbi:MAG: TetR/AcrR family transcriptional regulator [Alphaproteobacteria bacterium]
MPSIAIATEGSTRDRVVAVAAPLFAERGFAGVSMRDIADAAGIKAASLYNHFTDKEELYFSVLEQEFAKTVAVVEQSMDATGRPENRLKATIMALAGRSADDNVSRKLMHRELMDGDHARLERLTASLYKAPYDRMTQLFSEIAPKGNARTLTAYINALITGYFLLEPVLRQLDADLPMDPEVVGTEIAGLLLSNLNQGSK